MIREYIYIYIYIYQLTVSTISVQGMTPLHLFTDEFIKEWSLKG